MASFHTTKAFKLPTNYVAYDLETSDLYDDGGEVVEFGAVKVAGGKVDACFSEYCALDGPMNPRASEKNGITAETLVGARSRGDVFLDFAAFVGDLPLVGFNNHHFDDAFIDREAERVGVRSPVQNGSWDSIEILLDVEGRKSSLEQCCERYDICNERAHSALSDTKATHVLFEVLRSKAKALSTDVRDIEATAIGDELVGEVVCITGDTPLFTKHTGLVMAMEHGAVLSNDVTKKVTLVVNLEGRESVKVKRAKDYGIRVIDLVEFKGRCRA